VSPADQIQFVLLQKSTDDFLPKDETHASLGFSPHLDAAFRVSPQQVAEQPSVRYIGGSHDAVNLVNGRQIWGKSSVHTEDAVFNDAGHGHAVKAVNK
jgi:hypothetical protein